MQATCIADRLIDACFDRADERRERLRFKLKRAIGPREGPKMTETGL
jgi:hypothetical protein